MIAGPVFFVRLKFQKRENVNKLVLLSGRAGRFSAESFDGLSATRLLTPPVLFSPDSENIRVVSARLHLASAHVSSCVNGYSRTLPPLSS